MTPTQDPRTPVTLLTGWLGAGKTTLLNRLLSEPGGRRFAVLVNACGDSGGDQRLGKRGDEDLVELSNGCVCCTVRGDLVAALARLRQRRLGGLLPRRRFDHVLLETTGIAEPAPLLRTFLVEDSVAFGYRVASIVALVDARHAGRALTEVAARDQVALAELLLLNKTDLAAADQLDAVEARLQAMNPVAPLLRCQDAAVEPAEILAERPPRQLDLQISTDELHHDHGDLRAVTLRADEPLDELKAQLWLDSCARMLGGELVRWKGFLRLAGHEEAAVLQGTYELYTVDAAGPWQGPPRTELVFIGRGLEREVLERGLRAAIAAD